jgi:hypothetical protein
VVRATAQPAAERDRILVWIDGREACIVRSDAEARPQGIERLFAEDPTVPHPTGHLRHSPVARHGEEWKSAADRRRERQLEAFIEGVERRLDPTADLLVMGPGPVHERLARRVREADLRHRNERTVSAEAASRMTIRQLEARLRRLAPG